MNVRPVFFAFEFGEGQSALDVGGSLPWRSELYEPALKKVRSELKGVELVLSCVAQKTVEGSESLGDGDSPQLLMPSTVCSTAPLNVQNAAVRRGSLQGGLSVG